VPDARQRVQHPVSAGTINFKDCTMNTRFTTSLGMALLVLSLGACSGMSTRDKNTAAGAAIGGVAGAVLTGGSTAGTVGGAAVGGVIGNQIDPNKK
jgi:osmotically inducible lipoprotein OsmB